MSMTEDEFEKIVILREREFQMMGAAISTRNWHDMETAYNAGRDRLDSIINDAKRWSWTMAGREAQSYANGLEAAANVAENLCADMTVEANAETSGLISTMHRASAQTAGKIAATIRAATPTPPTLNSWANTPEAEHERILLMAEIELHLKSCRIFLTTREKMHPVGVDIHDELLAKVTAAIEATGSEKAHG